MSSEPNPDMPEPAQSSTGPAQGVASLENPVEPGNASPVVNLQVISPSQQVGSTLFFPSLLATTTVKEVKEKIRDTLEVSPSADSQRLIYRGRLLARDTETMMEIFGADTLRGSDRQTFHLVLRDNTANPLSTTFAPSNPLNPILDRNFYAQPQGNTGPIGGARMDPADPSRILPPLPQSSTPGPRRNDRNQIPQFHGPAHIGAQNEHQHRLMLQRLEAEHAELTEQLNHFLVQDQRFQDQRLRAYENAVNGRMPSGSHYPGTHGNMPHGSQHALFQNSAGQQYALPGFQNLLAQHQQFQQRVPMGPSGSFPTTATQNVNQTSRQGPPSRTQSPSLSHGHTPDHTTTITRHGVNSNGERWQITVNESTTVIPPGHNHYQNPAAPANPDVTAPLQHLLNSAERLAAITNRLQNLNHGQRPGGTPPPGINLPSEPQRPSSTPPIGRVARPITTSTHSFPIPSTMPSSIRSSTTSANSSPLVYIMNSPNGPQALLVHNSQTFYSGNPYVAQQLNGSSLPTMAGEVRNRRDRPHRHRHRHRDANGPPADGANAAPQAPAEQAQHAHQHVHQNAQPMRIALWPHIWLIIRLLIFIWYFTSGGNSSWSRLIVIWGMSLFLFILNTGVLNDVLGAFWNPIRQHLENLLPLAGHHGAARGAPAQQANGNAAGVLPAPHLEPNPEEVARRLLEQRRQQDASWLMTQFRRVEHAVLLFVASIVPGTAERHIEARTIEENRLLEERRQAAAAAAAALEATPVENAEGETTDLPVVAGENEGNGAIPAAGQEQVAVPV